MKYDTYQQYDPRATSQALPAFLTVWSSLGNYHEDLVLLGGLVPLCICQHPENDNTLPRPATLDVDLGVALGASAGQYGTLSSDLRGNGFFPSKAYPGRFERMVDGVPLYVDFLVEDGTHTTGLRVVDDVPANVIPGVKRALETARSIQVKGVDLYGAQQIMTARVCEIGPFLVLKLRAFLNRQQPKDAFDILYTAHHYDHGIEQAIAGFVDEVSQNNPACRDAITSLQQHFGNENDSGPMRASHFVFGELVRSESSDTRLKRTLIRQDMVDLAQALLAAIDPVWGRGRRSLP